MPKPPVILHADKFFQEKNLAVVQSRDLIKRNLKLISKRLYDMFVLDKEETTEIEISGRFLCFLTMKPAKQDYSLIIADCQNEEDVALDLLQYLNNKSPDLRKALLKKTDELSMVYERNYDLTEIIEV